MSSEASDLVDVHARHPWPALVVAKTRARRLVFTPGSSFHGLMAWPYTRRMRSFINSASQIVCHSEIERDLLCRAAPRLANRVEVVPDGVDSAALEAATPFDTSGTIVLTVDRLDGAASVARVIAAVPSLDADFRLVIVGDGPARDRLEAYAADLRVSPRVDFVGAVADELLYRWLRTARVVVTLPDERGSGLQVTEARAAGASVVASDVPVNRWAAERLGAGHVIFVAPKGSPLDLADAIEEAARLAVLPTVSVRSAAAPSWEPVIDSMWMLYRDLISGHPRSLFEHEAVELVGVEAQADRVNGGSH
jgi:glycosyltransferase involved in cell wall biosynthesis